MENKGPQQTSKEFLKKEGLITKTRKRLGIKTRSEKLEERIKEEQATKEKVLKEPILILIKNNQEAEILENMIPGEFIIPQENDKPKVMYLTTAKMLSLHYADNYYKCWIGHEDNAFPYPEEPVYGARIIRQVIEQLSMNYKNFKETNIENEKTKRWLIIGLIVVIVVVLILNKPDFFMNLINGGATTNTTINHTINSTITQPPI